MYLQMVVAALILEGKNNKLEPDSDATKIVVLLFWSVKITFGI